MHVYSLTPIDYWDGFRPWVDYLQDQVRLLVDRTDKGGEGADETIASRLQDEADGLLKAVAAVREHTNWEGDGEWMVGALPLDGQSGLIYAVKQSNNGATFVVSPAPLTRVSELEPTVCLEPSNTPA